MTFDFNMIELDPSRDTLPFKEIGLATIQHAILALMDKPTHVITGADILSVNMLGKLALHLLVEIETMREIEAMRARAAAGL